MAVLIVDLYKLMFICGVVAVELVLQIDSFVTYEERVAIIKMAKEEGMKSILERESMASLKKSTTITTQKMNYHLSSLDAKSKAKARLRYEELVSTAETKFIQLRNDKVAEYEAMPLKDYHRNPAQLFNTDELKELYEISGCDKGKETRTTDGDYCKGKLFHRLYRSIDGSCNNLLYSKYGSASSEVNRLIPSEYENGVNHPRGHAQAVCNTNNVYQFTNEDQQCDGTDCFEESDEFLFTDFLSENPALKDPCDKINGPFSPALSSPDYIASKLVLDKKPFKLPFSKWLLLWARFVINDIVSVPDIGADLAPECGRCEFNGVCDSIRLHPGNLNLSTDSHDNPQVGEEKEVGHCVSVRRSVMECWHDLTGKFPPRNQLNDVTAYLDGSMIYGSTPKLASSLRMFKKGLLKEGPHGKLPYPTTDSFCGPRTLLPVKAGTVSMCGDYCCLSKDPLTSLHQIFLRFHNTVTQELSKLNPEWNDETLYQETRRIIIAVIQKITYRDFLPKIFTGDVFEHLVRQYKGYNSTVNPQVTMAFSDIITMGIIFPNDIHDDSIQDDLFRTAIQKGREHGLPSYGKFRKFIEENLPHISSPSLYDSYDATLSELYGSIDNVDLIVGALGERSIITPLGRTALIGQTLASIIGLEFKNIRDGDRLFYQQEGVFTKDQYSQLDKVELSHLICQYSGDEVQTVSSDSFLENFETTNCDMYSDTNLDLSHWKESVCFIRVDVLPSMDYTSGRIVGVSIDRQQSLTRVHTNEVHPSCLPVTCPASDASSISLIAFLNARPLSSNCTIAAMSFPQATKFSNSDDISFINITLVSSMVDGHALHHTRQSCEDTSLSSIKWECQFDSDELAAATVSEKGLMSIPIPPGFDL